MKFYSIITSLAFSLSIYSSNFEFDYSLMNAIQPTTNTSHTSGASKTESLDQLSPVERHLLDISPELLVERIEYPGSDGEVCVINFGKRVISTGEVQSFFEVTPSMHFYPNLEKRRIAHKGCLDNYRQFPSNGIYGDEVNHNAINSQCGDAVDNGSIRIEEDGINDTRKELENVMQSIDV